MHRFRAGQKKSRELVEKHDSAWSCHRSDRLGGLFGPTRREIHIIIIAFVISSPRRRTIGRRSRDEWRANNFDPKWTTLRPVRGFLSVRVVACGFRVEPSSVNLPSTSSCSSGALSDARVSGFPHRLIVTLMSDFGMMESVFPLDMRSDGKLI